MFNAAGINSCVNLLQIDLNWFNCRSENAACNIANHYGFSVVMAAEFCGCKAREPSLSKAIQGDSVVSMQDAIAPAQKRSGIQETNVTDH